ncbi:capsule assembly Wzi family protein [Mangrovibacterium diazotrophicum]|uniref:Capsule assembly protein Wzi n=1 Tax=Mangrovibacterium diazotrophicum TaxID=1261403 RepID=A0A419W9A6_9BACT|nr:capsule assembly Wzi family protein [Mangrovibacterium diazotrophicum]RKD91994.1 capsule assembly protein Wzi [Mangrovibacterium diazotrophicum]
MRKLKFGKAAQLICSSLYIVILLLACFSNTLHAQSNETLPTLSKVEGSGSPTRYALFAEMKQDGFGAVTNSPAYPKYYTSSGTSQQVYESPKTKNYGAFIQTGVILTTDSLVPFWMRSRQYGSIPLDGFSGSVLAGAHKEYNKNRKQLLDWAAGFEGRFNVNESKNEVLLIEGYVKGRISMFEIKGGRFKDFTGLVDSTLSSGAFSLSGNALGIPKVEIGFPEYWDIPFTRKLIAVKGNLSYGWFGKNYYRNWKYYFYTETYYHQTSFYGRLGKPNWKVKLYGGINHQAIWGGEDEAYNSWDLSQWETFKYVFIGKTYRKKNIPATKIGNHVGSIDQALTYDTKKLSFFLYHQFFYEAGAIATFANAKDGLWGLSVKNKVPNSNTVFTWNKILFEFLYSKSQGGEPDSKPRNSGFEDYYDNPYYVSGWTYQGENLGNPFFTQVKYARDELPEPKSTFQSFSNNRLMLFHLASEFSISGFYCKTLLSYSMNYGNYTTSPSARGLGDHIRYFPPPYFGQQNQFSGYLETCKLVGKNLELGVKFSIDQGDLLYNSLGGAITLTKRW